MHPRQTIRTLNRLIRTCRDGEMACLAWSEAAASADLRQRLLERSAEWGRQGDELQALVLLLGGQPARSGTAGGQILESWVLLKTLLLGRSDLPVVLDWEHAQRGALRGYQQALRGTLSARIRRTLTLQAARLSDRHHRLEDLRGQFAAHSP